MDLAVAFPLRAALLPNIPTIAESGFQGIEAAVIFGVVEPTGTPDTVVFRLNLEINRSPKQSQLRQSLIARRQSPNPWAALCPRLLAFLRTSGRSGGRLSGIRVPRWTKPAPRFGRPRQDAKSRKRV
ncbi:hypothetical protein LL969_01740 [Xanthomonas campestris pv. phormiicola]|nr:hypothetical protein [Xanthomonas campestris pv. phormiicola]